MEAIGENGIGQRHTFPLGRWLGTHDHKDVGTLYLWFSFVMLVGGGTMALMIRAELFRPGLQFIDAQVFNQLATLHGLIMIFGAIMPVFVGFASWQIPMMIGAREMAFPRLNKWCFWLLPAAAVVLIASMLVPGGSAAVGWTVFAPMSIDHSLGMDLVILAIDILAVSSILASINIITTILNLRMPGMRLMKMPMFVWCWLITAYLLLAVMPLLAGALTLTLTDRYVGTGVFNGADGADPMLLQHVFRLFGHPEVYIVAIPGFGVISQVIPAFSRKPLFGYASMVFATVSIAVISLLIWVHDTYTAGMSVGAQLFYIIATTLVAVPVGVKVFSWIATMWKGSLSFETPMLFAIGFLCLFTFGGFTGLVLGFLPADVQLHGTYYVVAHFHYVMVAGTLFAAFSGVYYWLPKWTGNMYDEVLGRWHFWLTVFFFNLTFLVQHLLGLAAMPRRVPDYSLQYADLNMISSIGAFGLGFSQLLFLYIVLKAIRRGDQAPQKPWEGADTLEWTVRHTRNRNRYNT